jgi:hypothetical protein
MPPEPYPETLTIPELAALLDVGYRTVSNWISHGVITVKRGPGNIVSIPVAGVREFLPPPGDTLMCPGRIMFLTGWTKSQLAYARRQGRVTAVVLPSGTNRYLRSQIAAMLRGQAAGR